MRLQTIEEKRSLAQGKVELDHLEKQIQEQVPSPLDQPNLAKALRALGAHYYSRARGEVYKGAERPEPTDTL